MDDEEIVKGISEKRDEIARQLADARHQRSQLQIGNIDKHRDFLQKIGELSFIIGGALVPVVIVTGSHTVANLVFVLIGVGLYLLNGLVALWLSKSILERNSGDAPFVGLEEEIHTYPVVYAHNKLIHDLHNEDFLNEYRKTSLDVIEWARSVSTATKPKISVWLDLLLVNFVVASMLVAKSVWTFGELSYWIAFVVILLFMVALMVVSYVKAWQNQVNLAVKQKELADIKKTYQDWHNANIFGKE